MSDVRLIRGDCLDVMQTLEPGSVDMVLTDPPYGTMKGASLDGWDEGDTDWDVAMDPTAVMGLCERLLRMNGITVLFSQEPYTSRIVTQAAASMPFLYRLVWLKDHFANPLMAKKAPVSYYEDIVVYAKKYDNQGLHPMRAYSLSVFDYCGGSLKAINHRLGHRKAEHFFYVNSTQYGLCTQQTYDELCVAYGLKAMPGFLSFKELEAIHGRFQRRFQRRFNLEPGCKYKSNVLQYKKDYGGLHPTQKPLALMEDLVRTYTNEGDTVLDFTMGSGTTGVACVNTGRKFIGIEKDEHYFNVASERISNAQQSN